MNTPDLATQLGLHRSGREWRGRCPACGYGSNAFTLSVGKGGRPLLWCASCQLPDGGGAILRNSGLGLAPVWPSQNERLAEARQTSNEAARTIWRDAAPVVNSPADRYLDRRGLPHLRDSTALRYRPTTSHPGNRGIFPAMIAAVQDAAGEVVAVHRTYVQPDGRKAEVDPPKASKGPITGAAVRLDPTAPELVIGEGIESAASAGVILGFPAWAAISAGNLASGLILPNEVRSVVIAADHDGPGLSAAEAACRRWQREGRKVRVIKPRDRGSDFNDALLRRLGRA